MPLAPSFYACEGEVTGGQKSSYDQLQLYCIAAVMSAPTDVDVRRLSMTAVEVTWDPPAFHGVAGYRVEYGALTDDDQRRPRFLDTGPYTVAQVSVIVIVITVIIFFFFSRVIITCLCALHP